MCLRAGEFLHSANQFAKDFSLLSAFPRKRKANQRNSHHSSLKISQKLSLHKTHIIQLINRRLTQVACMMYFFPICFSLIFLFFRILFIIRQGHWSTSATLLLRLEVLKRIYGVSDFFPLISVVFIEIKYKKITTEPTWTLPPQHCPKCLLLFSQFSSLTTQSLPKSLQRTAEWCHRGHHLSSRRQWMESVLSNPRWSTTGNT